MVTKRELVQMALELKKPPRIPVALLGGGAWAVRHAGTTFAAIKNDPERIAEVFVRFCRLVGNALLWTGSNFLNYPAHCLGVPIKDDSADSPALEGTVLQSLDGLDQLSVEKVLRHPTMQAIIRSHHRVADQVGKETFVMPTQWAPFTLAARILGVERLLMASIEDPDRLLRLIRFATDLIRSILEPVLDHPDIPGTNFSDPVASCDVISPAAFRRFAAPFLAQLCQWVKAKGKYCEIHICGNTTPLLADLLTIGPHAFSVENKVNLKEAKSALGGKVCVVGNVSPTGPFLSGTPAEVIAEAQACLKAWGDDGGYILATGCDFSNQVPLENMLALMSVK
jgi:uroporphyrinogen decarboxylase